MDASRSPDALVRYLDHAADAESAMKHYMAVAHAKRRPTAPVLDVGCGAGHDLAMLRRVGVPSVGVDASAVMLRAGRERAAAAAAPLVQSAGESLPFRDGAFGGARIERVLMHVTDPSAVIAEAVRCVAPGGLVTAFEPDWSSFEVVSDVLPHRAAWITVARHPDMGARLWELLEQHGCVVLDRVEERSVWSSLAAVNRVLGFPDCVGRAVARGLLTNDDADAWTTEQRRRDASGTFRATIKKILIVARTPG